MFFIHRMASVLMTANPANLTWNSVSSARMSWV